MVLFGNTLTDVKVLVFLYAFIDNASIFELR